MTIAKKRFLPVFMALLLIVTNFAATYDAYANPIIYPIAEGAMYLTGTLLAAFGISLGDDTETESIRETKLAVFANVLGKRIMSEWSEPDNVLYRGLINLALPGSVLDLTSEQYDLFMRMGHIAYDTFTSAPNNTVTYNALPSGLPSDYYIHGDGYKKEYYPTLQESEVIKIADDLSMVVTYYNNSVTQLLTATYHPQRDASSLYWTNEFGNINRVSIGANFYGWAVWSAPMSVHVGGGNFVTLNQIGIVAVNKDATGLSYGEKYITNNFVTNLKFTDYIIKPVIDTSVVVGDTYDIPSTDGKKKVAIPQSLSDFGTTVKTVADVIPASQTVPTDPPADSKINWEPLKVTGTLFTTKFPFSLPWDILRTFQALLIDNPTLPKWDIKWHDQILHKDFGFTIDLTGYDRIFKIARNFILVAFNVGLIMATRKLVGGAS